MSKSIYTTIFVGSLSLLLASCAGRDPRPIAVTNATDSSLDCASITREFNANEDQIISTTKERNAAIGKNVVFAATGVLLFAPALFFIDPKSPERVEIDALRSRNKVLTDLARTKRCPVPQSRLEELYKRIDNPPADTGSGNR